MLIYIIFLEGRAIIMSPARKVACFFNQKKVFAYTFQKNHSDDVIRGMRNTQSSPLLLIVFTVSYSTLR